MDESRLFWVVNSPDTTEEIFTTKEEAERYAIDQFGKKAPYTISIAEVRHFFQEDNGSWNYDDYADTFDTIITITWQTDTREQLNETAQ